MRGIRGKLGRFGRDGRGSVSVAMAISVLPLVGVAGAAVDYSRAALVRTDLARAVDGATLALAKQPATATAADLTAAGQRFFDAIYRSRGYEAVAPVTVSRTPSEIRVSVAGQSRNAFMGLFGVRTTPVAAAATTNWGTSTSKIELALVLDNTGSMRDTIGGQRKIDALQGAAKDMLAKLRERAVAADTIKVSVVPFDTEVRLPTANRNAGWLRFASASDRAAWTGYVIDRDQPYDVTASAPTGPASAYPGLRTSQFAAYGDLATVRPLTSLFGWSDYQDLVGVIDGMRPRGNTDIAIGFAWGMATLAPGAPFGTTAAPSDPAVKQFMVLLTDGENTQNHVNGAPNTNVAQIDGRTEQTCSGVKGANVEVFTIRLLEGNQSLLRRCASGPNGDGHYFDVQSTADLSAAFNRIVDAITRTRLTS